MKQRNVHRLAGIALISMAASAAPQAGESIIGDDLVAMVSGRSWALSTYGNTSNPATAMVWDFRKDGSVCARFAGSRVGDKCADEGRWRIDGDKLCWDLTWFGGTFGFKTACSIVQRVGPERVELRNEKLPDLTFMVVRPL